MKLKFHDGGNRPHWYRQDIPSLAGVTNEPVNPALGLRGIKIYSPEEDADEFCEVRIILEVIAVTCTVYESTSNPGTFYLRMPQKVTHDEDGDKCFEDVVDLAPKLVAQVLRYIETQVEAE